MTTYQGAADVIELAKGLCEKAGHVEEFYDHKAAARLMRDAAKVLVRLAPLDPEIEVVLGEH